MNFLLDLLFVGMQEILVGIVVAFAQVPFDVVTALLTNLLVPGG